MLIPQQVSRRCKSRLRKVRVDKPHVEGQQPHVHFKDGTSLNQDGTVHNAHRGIPNPTKKIKDWLIKNGWKVND